MTKKLETPEEREARLVKGRAYDQQEHVNRRGKNWNLTFDEYVNLIGKRCNYCDDEFNTPSITGIGLDRLDNNKGYEINNVVSCCTTCNTIRSDLLTPEETKIAIQAILTHRANKKAGNDT
jgi:hypothetical protein